MRVRVAVGVRVGARVEGQSWGRGWSIGATMSGSKLTNLSISLMTSLLSVDWTCALKRARLTARKSCA